MKITVLIPARNEEATIQRCIESVLNQSRQANQIIVVDDASTDNTLKILKKYTKKALILSLNASTGHKSHAQEYGMRYVKGGIVITTDADTVLHPDFVKNIVKKFDDKNVIACAGQVKSMNHNILTACRQIEYTIGQEIHKLAQTHINALFVIPGCAAAFRTKEFKKHIEFDHDTLTEDLDFTYKHHRKNLKIGFANDAIVYTEDPSTVRDYVTQLRRWYGGNWQNLIKHKKVLNKPNNAFELSIIFFEGIIFPFLLLLALIFNLKVFLFYYLSYTVVVSIFAVYCAYKDKRVDVLLAAPIHLFVSFINYAIFIEQFVKEVLLRKNNLIWIQPRRRIA